MQELSNKIDVLLNNFQELTKKTELFLDCDVSLQNRVKTNLKHVYDFLKSEEVGVRSTDALPELLIRNFDDEQIWQELELQNDQLLTTSLKNVSKLLVNKETLMFSNLQNEVKEIEESVESVENESKLSLEPEDEEDSDNDHDSGNTSHNSENELDIGEGDENDEDSPDSPCITESKPHRKGRQSEVEDDFFKLDEMENFLRSEEQKLDNPESKKDNTEESEGSEEESVDFFEDNSDEEDESSKTARFKDFFKANEEPNAISKAPKRNKFLEDMDENDEQDDQVPEPQQKSSLELREERLMKKIGHLERAAVGEKPWPLKGEIKADSRPVNSLLEEVLEFDLTSRPAPVITEETTLQLEDIIKQRIKDKVFDSVERKAKPVNTPMEFKKKLVLDQEKSKQSLAQIYEKEYINQQAALDPDNQDKEEVEPQLHKEIQTMMRDLFNKLDALSNYHFTPKPAIPELKIVNNLPAISMEEVAPVTASDAALLAPEEVRNKTKGDIVGKSERTTSDKNRERRKKKAKQKAHLKNLPINKNMLGPRKHTNQKNLNSNKKGVKSKNVENMEQSLSTKSFKSSKAFFTELQEQVHSHISEKVLAKKRKKVGKKLEAKRIKL
ncbi:unnamed protein product [Phaedon cochleariae]|uniref:U3 small nucleolar ribonucleoprotein protein MPP10 n=1 Tax=Phaedon cochleariae TaxID=80249 RepID=A0A9P0D9A9_PHACE|nr:unnamed protein product [Phaedon cochleariae]